MLKMNLCNLKWMMHQVGDSRMVSARVPGSVYGDLLAAGLMEDPFWKDNEDAACALMEEDYEYQASFSVDPEFLKEEHLLLRFDGLDTVADVYLNDSLLGSAANMHRTWEFDVKKLLRDENSLRVYFHSPNKYIKALHDKEPRFSGGDAMPGYNLIRKAHCMFGWDWGAHLPDAGIYRPISLLAFSGARFDSVMILQHHEEGQVTLDLSPELTDCDLNLSELSYTVTLTGPDGTVICTKSTEADGGLAAPKDAVLAYNGPASSEHAFLKSQIPVIKGTSVTISNPELWWPNGYGAQPLYTVSVTLRQGDKTLDVWERKIGLRTITVSRDKLPIGGEEFATTVNGVKIFSMGADYIPEDHLLGRVTPETTRALLSKAAWAHHNSIRVWGGGYYPNDWFFDICDELGLLVWQDFMFACNSYELTPEFEANVIPEFEQNIKRIRHHACLAIFSGNNEIEEAIFWSGIFFKKSLERDYCILFEKLISDRVASMAPQTFYWPSSPSSGGSFDNPMNPEVGDQHYWEVWHGNKPFSEYRKYLFRYCSEFGFQSFPSEKTVDTFTDDPKDKNIFSYIMERHQRNGSANGKIMNYMQQTYLYPTDFNTLIYASQLLQADGIRYGVEHFRRNRGVCMGAIVWQLNDCWPVASWSSIDYTGRLKALHYYEKRFFAPIMISCEEDGMMNSEQYVIHYPQDYKKGIRLAVANETFAREALTVNWAIRDTKANIIRQESQEITVEPLSTCWLERVDLKDLPIFDQYISYEVTRKGEVLSEGTVNLSYPKYFHYEDPELSCVVDGNKITVTAKAYAKSVEISNENDDLILSDNYFDMNAGSKTVIIEKGEPTKLKLRSVYEIK